jgi:hypothetical protein
LEKERQEFLSAQLQFQHLKRQVEFLQQDRDRLLQRLDQLTGIEAEHGLLLSEKERLLRELNQPVANELLAFSEQIAHHSSEANEIAEAIAAGSDVIAGLEQVIQSLESAENWGTWDIFGGGLLSSAVKHSRIDEARKEIGDVQSKMSQFKRELADVQKSVDLQIDIGELESFADFFFDGLIIDWIVQSKIVQSLERSETTRDRIIEAVKELEDLREITQKKIRDAEEKPAQLIERA